MMDFLSLMTEALAALREEKHWEFACSEPEVLNRGDLADLMELLVAATEAGDSASAQRLLQLLAPTGAWDDAGMDAMLGQRCFEALDDLLQGV